MFDSLRVQDQVAVQQFPGGQSMVGVITGISSQEIHVRCGDKRLSFNAKDGTQIDQVTEKRGYRLICRFNEED